MKYFKDKKSWTVAIVESFGILIFNAIFIPSFYDALGDQVSTANVIIVSAALFFLRILWFYLNMIWRLLWETGKVER